MSEPSNPSSPQQMEYDDAFIDHFFFESPLEEVRLKIQQAMQDTNLDFFHSLNTMACQILSVAISETIELAVSKEEVLERLQSVHFNPLPTLYPAIFKISEVYNEERTIRTAVMVYIAYHAILRKFLIHRALKDLKEEIRTANFIPESLLDVSFNIISEAAVSVPPQKNYDPLVPALIVLRAPVELLHTKTIEIFKGFRKCTHEDIESTQYLQVNEEFTLFEIIQKLAEVIKQIEPKILFPEEQALLLITDINYNPSEKTKLQMNVEKYANEEFSIVFKQASACQQELQKAFL